MRKHPKHASNLKESLGSPSVDIEGSVMTTGDNTEDMATSKQAFIDDSSKQKLKHEPSDYLSEKDGNENTKPKKKHLARNIIVGVLIFLALLVCCILAFLFINTNIGKSAFVGSGAGITPPEPAITNDSGKTIIKGGDKYVLNEDVVSLCIMACDRRPNGSTQTATGSVQADAIMVLALNYKTGEIDVITVPRNSFVRLEHAPNKDGGASAVYKDYLCLAFAQGKDDAEGSQITVNAVSEMLYDLPINYYYTLNWAGLGKLADSVGGIEVEAIQDLVPFNIKKGETYNLTGDNAIWYVQYRNIQENSSMDDRQARQQQFIKLFAQKALSQAKTNPTVLFDIYKTLEEYSTTNLEFPEVLFLIWSVASNGVDSVDFKTITGTWEFDHKFPQLIPDEDQIYQTLLDVYYTKVE